MINKLPFQALSQKLTTQQQLFTVMLNMSNPQALSDRAAGYSTVNFPILCIVPLPTDTEMGSANSLPASA